MGTVSPPAGQAQPGAPPPGSPVEAWENTIWQGDCLELLWQVPATSVDLVLADLPYGTTRNRWDSIIPLDELWDAYRHVLHPDGCVVLTAAQPFTSALVMSNTDWFRYDWVWSKTVGSGQLNVKYQPLRTHESVLVFSPKRAPYYPQMEQGTPYTARRKTSNWNDRGYRDQSDHETVNTGTRYPKSVLHVPNPRIRNGHPTQKPLALFEYLIRTYTLPGQLVLDNVIGSGTTAVAAKNTARRFIGMEVDPVYVQMACDRLADDA